MKLRTDNSTDTDVIVRNNPVAIAALCFKSECTAKIDKMRLIALVRRILEILNCIS